jgi:hypothetical protein
VVITDGPPIAIETLLFGIVRVLGPILMLPVKLSEKFRVVPLVYAFKTAVIVTVLSPVLIDADQSIRGTTNVPSTKVILPDDITYPTLS